MQLLQVLLLGDFTLASQVRLKSYLSRKLCVKDKSQVNLGHVQVKNMLMLLLV